MEVVEINIFICVEYNILVLASVSIGSINLVIGNVWSNDWGIILTLKYSMMNFIFAIKDIYDLRLNDKCTTIMFIICKPVEDYVLKVIIILLHEFCILFMNV